jgi:hypothetical protein
LVVAISQWIKNQPRLETIFISPEFNNLLHAPVSGPESRHAAAFAGGVGVPGAAQIPRMNLAALPGNGTQKPPRRRKVPFAGSL